MSKVYLPNRDDVITLGNQIAPIVKQEIDDCYDAIELKGGWVPETEEDKNLRNLETSIRSIEDHMDEVLDGSTDTVTTNATRIRANAFYNYKNLRKIIAPNVIVCESGVCEGSGILDTNEVDAPFMVNVPARFFCQCTGMAKIDDNRIVTINTSSFELCNNVKYVNLPNCVSIGTAGFKSLTSCTSFNLPELKIIETASFQYLNALEEITFPKLESWNDSFNGCPNLKKITIGGQQIIRNLKLLSNCPKLTSLEFPNMGVDYVFSNSGVRNSLVTTCVITCNDGTIEYINGAWTIVRN